jgi:hypothetical protein
MGASLVRLGDPVGAVASFRRCLELATQLGDDGIAVDALVSLGLAHFRAGELPAEPKHGSTFSCDVCCCGCENTVNFGFRSKQRSSSGA